MRMPTESFILLVGKYCTGHLNDYNDMLFPKFKKNSVHISTM